MAARSVLIGGVEIRSAEALALIIRQYGSYRYPLEKAQAAASAIWALGDEPTFNWKALMAALQQAPQGYCATCLCGWPVYVACDGQCAWVDDPTKSVVLTVNHPNVTITGEWKMGAAPLEVFEDVPLTGGGWQTA